MGETMTIDDLIERLTRAREKVDGDTPVIAHDDGDPDVGIPPYDNDLKHLRFGDGVVYIDLEM